MDFDFAAFKDSLVELEKAERWKEELEVLKEAWARTHDPRLAGLCVDQCFYFQEIIDHLISDRFHRANKEILKTRIIDGRTVYEFDVPEFPEFPRRNWLFLDEVVGYGLNNGLDDPYFLWRLGHWMVGGPGSGYLLLNGVTSPITEQNFEETCERLLARAYELWPSPLVLCDIEASKDNWKWHFGVDEATKARARADMRQLNLRQNIADQEIPWYYDWAGYEEGDACCAAFFVFRAGFPTPLPGNPGTRPFR